MKKYLILAIIFIACSSNNLDTHWTGILSLIKQLHLERI